MVPLFDRLPTRRVPFVNYLLIAANVLVFLWEGAIEEAGYSNLVTDLGFIPYRFEHAPLDYAPTILTSMFMHGSWAHLGGNMLYLWIFGDNVEDAIGHFRYLLFYLVGGTIAASTQLGVDPNSTIPMVGASGAIAAVLGAYIALYPMSPISFLNPFPPFWFVFGLLIELPAWIVILWWFFLNVLEGFASRSGPIPQGGTAFFAHIGGFVAGIVLIRFFMIGKARAQADRWSGWRPPNRRPPSTRFG
jgi:membrane associated rhomboid family serine protease